MHDPHSTKSFNSANHPNPNRLMYITRDDPRKSRKPGYKGRNQDESSEAVTQEEPSGAVTHGKNAFIVHICI